MRHPWQNRRNNNVEKRAQHKAQRGGGGGGSLGKAPHLAVLMCSALAFLPKAAAAGEPTWPDIQKIFAQRCTICHSGKDPPFRLRLDTLQSALKGSERGPVLKRNNSKESELIRRVKGESQPRMPLTGPPLSEEEISQLERWVAAGMPAGKEVAAVEDGKPPTVAPGERETFEQVESIFLKRCAKCHKDDGIMGAPPEGLRLDTYANILAGGERVVLIPGKPDHSELIRRVEGKAQPRMPFDGPPWLDTEDISLLRKWIGEGAKDKQGQSAPIPVGREVRFRGTMTGPTSIDGAEFLAGEGVRRDKAPAPGDQIEIRGNVNERGDIEATRIRGR